MENHFQTVAPILTPIAGGSPHVNRSKKKAVRWDPRSQCWLANAGADPNGNRRRKKFPTEVEAIAWRQRQLDADKSTGLQTASLSSAVLHDVAHAIAALKQAGREPSPGYFTRLVSADLKRSPAASTMTFAAVVAEWLATKKTRRLKQRSIKDCAECIRPFLRVIGNKILGEITKTDIESVVAGAGDLRRRNLLAKLGGVFRHAIAQRYVSESPTASIILPRLPQGEPTPLTAADALKLLSLAVRHETKYRATAWVITRLLLGVRDAEAQRLTWSPKGLNLAAGYIHIDGKRRERTLWIDAARCVDSDTAAVIPPSALPLLRELATAYPNHCLTGQPVHPGRWRSDGFKKVARANGIPLSDNCMRATFASCHVARYRRPQLTAHWMGHRRGISILENHYLRYASYEDGALVLESIKTLAQAEAAFNPNLTQK